MFTTNYEGTRDTYSKDVQQQKGNSQNCPKISDVVVFSFTQKQTEVLEDSENKQFTGWGGQLIYKLFKQCAKKVLFDSPGLVDFPEGVGGFCPSLASWASERMKKGLCKIICKDQQRNKVDFVDVLTISTCICTSMFYHNSTQMMCSIIQPVMCYRNRGKL